MTSLLQALTAEPVALLAVIGRRHGLGIDSNLKKNTLVEIVAGALVSTKALRRRLARLSTPARAALDQLLLAGGSLSAPHLGRRYGPLRKTRPLLQADREQSDLSPLEELRLWGLIYQDAAVIPTLIFVPADLIPRLPKARRAAPPPLVSLPGPAPVNRLLNDLTVLLALLQRDPVPATHRRWLPPALLANWAAQSSIPAQRPRARSELQTGRRRFIHYLAESAGFINSPPLERLIPTPAAGLWLDAGYAAQLTALWGAWQALQPERWQRFRLPGHTWLRHPAAFLAIIHPLLLEIDCSRPAAFAQAALKQAPRLIDLPPTGHIEPDAALAEAIIALLTGPLTWLGLLQPETPPAASASESSARSDPLYRLTAQGRAWLENGDIDPQAMAPSAKFEMTTHHRPEPLRSELRFTPSPGLPRPADLAVLIDLADWCNGEYRLTALSAVAALQRGWSPAALRQALTQLAAQPLDAPAAGLLRAWAQTADRMTLRQAVILETTDPGIITRLAATRRGRSLIHRTLSPRAVIVDPARLDLLIHRLTDQEGVPPRQLAKNNKQLRRGSFLSRK